MPGVRTWAALVVLAVVAATTVAVAGPSPAATTAASVDATPADPGRSASTHAVRVTLPASTAADGQRWRDAVVRYRDEPGADTSEVTADTVRAGVDRGDDDPGTQVDVLATVVSTISREEGRVLQLSLTGETRLRSGDEVVVVFRPVENPSWVGNATVEVTVNSQSAGDTATGTVTYAASDANVTFRNQTTDETRVRVSSVTLSEGGFVAVGDDSGGSPDAVRGASAYLPPGRHRNVTVPLDDSLGEDARLHAHVHYDTDADRRFEFASTSGRADGIYRDRDGRIIASDAATVVVGEPSSTATPFRGATSPTATNETATGPSTGGGRTSGRRTGGTASTTTAATNVVDVVTSTPTATTGPGFDVTVAMLAALTAALLHRRRR